MVIILAKLDSNINYGQGRGTVLTSPVAATHDKWEGDEKLTKQSWRCATVDKAQLEMQLLTKHSCIN